MWAPSRWGSHPKMTRTMPTSAPSASIDQNGEVLSLAASAKRSFHVAGIAGSCQTRERCRTRMSAIHRA